MRQLTFRAVAMGAILGMIMSVSNLYVGLKIGWGMGVAITSCVLSFAIWKVFRKLVPGFFSSDMSILENNCMQSTASSAGAAIVTPLVAAVPAFLLITGQNIPPLALILFMICSSSLGVFMAIPMKRQMINLEQLKFPSGIVAASTLRSLYAKGSTALSQAKSLGIAGLCGAGLKWLTGAKIPFGIPETLPLPGTLMGLPLARWTIGFDVSLLMVAVGAIIGMHVGWSMLLGALINYFAMAPYAVSHGAITVPQDPATPLSIIKWSVWTGVPIMVIPTLIGFFAQWKTIARSVTGIQKAKSKSTLHANMAAIEVPSSWFAWGASLSCIGCILVLMFAFGTSWWMGIIAVALSFFLAMVACRATGETDITPIGAMGKVTQLLFGVLASGNTTTNLMTAGVTAGTASNAADLLTDLKSGYCLGAKPRQQFLAQYLGVFFGVLASVPVYYLLVPTASVIGTEAWPAPAAQAWAAVAQLLSKGFSQLHYTAKWGLLIGSFVGVVLYILPKVVPEKAKKFIPSAFGLSLGMIVTFSSSLGIFLGALIAFFFMKWNAERTDRYTYSLCSGAIAGESLMGIVIAALTVLGIIGTK
jgi:putative OPT family oligopeptide transporter